MSWRRRPQLLEISLVAHELRQSLNAILFALEQIHEDHEPTAQEARELCRREALHMSQIIDNVLNTYRNKRGTLHLNLAPVELASIVNNAIDSASATIVSRRHRISVSLPPDSITFVGDPVRLQQILTNLLTNSAKYTGASGHIYLNADCSREVVTIRVRDNGRGISPEQLPHIFDPRLRKPDACSDGLGLGLALVKSLVERHGGSVVAQSDGPDMGSQFTISLPAGGPDVTAGASDVLSG